MTREEQTISNLKKLKSFHNGSYGEDIDRAIRALEQQPCEDAISRADVKKYLSAPNENGDRVIYESDLDLLQPVQLKTERWIPVSERLPEEKINPITEDFYEYQCTVKFGDFYDVRSFEFGRGHWWHGGGLVDEYVIAWMPLLKPYEPQESED